MYLINTTKFNIFYTSIFERKRIKVKTFVKIFLLLPAVLIYSQKIGEFAPEKPPMEFPRNSLGVNLLFSDGGFGLGAFYMRKFSLKLKGSLELSFSEAKGEREFEYYDYYGNSFVVGKENRVFLIPLNVGVRYRLFEKDLTDNLRPYLMAGFGPAVSISTPYKEEFFASFKYSKFNFAAGGYLGFGANFGLSKKNLLGLSMKYSYIKFFSEGVEQMTGVIKKEIGTFFLELNIGMMY